MANSGLGGEGEGGYREVFCRQRPRHKSTDPKNEVGRIGKEAESPRKITKNAKTHRNSGTPPGPEEDLHQGPYSGGHDHKMRI